MKLLRIIPSMNPRVGGPCQGIRNSIPALAELGVENEVVCLDDPNEDFISRDPFKIHALGGKIYPGYYNARLAGWLEANIHQFDALIIHGLWLYHSYVTIKTVNSLRSKGALRGLKVYIMPHGMLDPWFQRDKSRRLKALRNEIYWRLIERNVVNSADGLLFTCEQELLLARQTFRGYLPKRELNVGYGIKNPPDLSGTMTSAFREKNKTLGDSPYLLFLSRLHPKKGVDLLIDAYLQLERIEVLLPHLVIAGPVEGEYAQAMKEKASLSDKIHFTGMLQGDAKWGAFYGCETFILPSHQENFGISVVEALACRKPVLISDQINIYREIASGGGGLIESDTLEGVKNLLKKWMAMSSIDRKRMSESAEEIYLSEFSIQQAAIKFKAILYSLLYA